MLADQANVEHSANGNAGDNQSEYQYRTGDREDG
jgi:hypothetical protein